MQLFCNYQGLRVEGGVEVTRKGILLTLRQTNPVNPPARSFSLLVPEEHAEILDLYWEDVSVELFLDEEPELDIEKAFYDYLRKHIKESFFEKEDEMSKPKTTSGEEENKSQDSLLEKLSFLEAYAKGLEERLNEIENKSINDSQIKEKTFKIDSFQVGHSPVVVTFDQVPGHDITWSTEVGSLTVNNGEGSVVIIPTVEGDWVVEYDEINRTGTLNGEPMTKINSQTFPVYN